MTHRLCTRCQAILAAPWGEELCPACLLEQGLNVSPDAPRTRSSTTGPGFVPPRREDLADSFPQLELLDLIGAGGMGAVYRARQKSLDRIVALKILPQDLAADPAFEERFAREAKTMARLNHPNIVTVYEFGKAGPWFYLLMEYVDGINLRQAIQAHSLASSDALGVVHQVCDALQYAHEEGVIHRDIKPENILLDQRGRVRIADFGLAKILGDAGAEVTLTRTRQVVGTWHYMAPEQWERPDQVDHRADLYSLGVVFYELLTGHLPVGRFELPSEMSPSDPKLDQVVLKALQREPARRYQAATELRTDLDKPPRVSPSQIVVPPQAESPTPAKTHDSNPRGQAVPFTLMSQGNELGTGIVRADERHLTLEYQAHWAVYWAHLGAIKPGFYETGIPYDRISKIEFRASWLGSVIDVQTDSVLLVKDIPSHRNGSIELRVQKKNQESADQLVRCVQERIGQPSGDTPSPLVHREISLESDDAESESGFTRLDKVGWLIIAVSLALCALAVMAMLGRTDWVNRDSALYVWFQGSLGLLGGWAVLNRAARGLSHLAVVGLVLPFSTVGLIAGVVTAVWYFDVVGTTGRLAYRAREKDVPNSLLRFLGLAGPASQVIPTGLAIAASLQLVSATLLFWGSLTLLVLMLDREDGDYLDFAMFTSFAYPALLAGMVSGWTTLRRGPRPLVLVGTLLGMLPMGIPGVIYWPFNFYQLLHLPLASTRRWFLGEKNSDSRQGTPLIDPGLPKPQPKKAVGAKPSVIRDVADRPVPAAYRVAACLLWVVAITDLLLPVAVYGAWLERGRFTDNSAAKVETIAFAESVDDANPGWVKLAVDQRVVGLPLRVALASRGWIQEVDHDDTAWPAGSQFPFENLEGVRMSWLAVLTVGLLGTGCLVSVFLSWAAWRLWFEGDRAIGVFAAVLGLLPVHAGVVLGFPLGLLALILLVRGRDRGVDPRP